MRQPVRRNDLTGVGDIDLPAVACRAALAADRDAEGLERGIVLGFLRARRLGRALGIAAGPAAAADRLGIDARRNGAGRLDQAIVDDLDVLAVAGLAPVASESDRQRAVLRRAHRPGKRAGHAAITAAAADALREQHSRAVAIGPQRAVIGDLDIAAVVACPALAAERKGHGHRFRAEGLRRRQPGQIVAELRRIDPGHAAVAAATTDALGDQGACRFAGRPDRAVIGDLDPPAGGTLPAVAADRQGSCDTVGTGQTQGARRASGPATAAQALHENAGRPCTVGFDVGSVGDQHDTAGLAVSTLAAQRHRSFPRLVGRQGARKGQAAGTAATAQRLRQYAVGVAAERADKAVGVQGDVTPLAALAAVAAHGQRHLLAVARRAREAYRRATIAATAAYALDENGMRAFTAGRDRAVRRGIDRPAFAAITTVAAKRDADCTGARAAGQGAGKTAVTAAAADALREQAVGVGAGRRQITRRRGANEVGAAPLATLAAERDCDRCLRGNRTAEGKPAGPTATADRLRNNRVGLVSRCRDATDLVHPHDAGLAARAAVATQGQRRGDVAQCRRQGRRKTAGAAAAAHRLGEDPVGAEATRRNVAGLVELHESPIAAGSTDTTAAECDACAR